VGILKLTLIGGGGVRTPLMVDGLIRWQHEVPIEKLVLYDSNPEKLEIIGGLVSHLVLAKGAPFEVEVTTNVREAVMGADFIYTAIRVGGDEARVVDERIPLKYGIIGQETTGPGGFAMALRTIPVMLEYAKIIEELAPNAWLINFTNPSGLITEALRKHTNLKVIGICDAPSSMKLEIAKFLKEQEDDIYINYFGLNHLGWIDKIMVKGKDYLPDIIENYNQFKEGYPHMSCFSRELVETLNLLPNEYLYYYYYREQAVENMKQSINTRGEQIVKLNHILLGKLKDKVKQGNLQEALNIYEEIMSERNRSYMTVETGSSHTDQLVTLESEGYEGLAMSILSSIAQNKKKLLILNVPNHGVIPELNHEDVIEVSCLLDGNGPVPLSVGKLPNQVQGLVQTVKQYERLTIDAAVNGNYESAVMALAIHPLVSSYSLAKRIVEDYFIQHKEYLPQFRMGREANV
jgi:6-phospho-beta-glucosidase